MSRVTVNWQESAAYVGSGDLFFGPEVEKPHARQVREASAIAICRPCPVRLECLEHALSQPSQYGVAGGVGEERRAALRHAWLKRQQRGSEAA
jgi:WhiB family transcriptional regulator, redox-sensing transcriptional regulator